MINFSFDCLLSVISHQKIPPCSCKNASRIIFLFLLLCFITISIVEGGSDIPECCWSKRKIQKYLNHENQKKGEWKLKWKNHFIAVWAEKAFSHFTRLSRCRHLNLSLISIFVGDAWTHKKGVYLNAQLNCRMIKGRQGMEAFKRAFWLK